MRSDFGLIGLHKDSSGHRSSYLADLASKLEVWSGAAGAGLQKSSNSPWESDISRA